MEIKGAWLAELCGTKRQNVYMLTRNGKLEKSLSGLYNIADDLNRDFLTSHNKSKIDVENFVKKKESLASCRSTSPKNTGEQQKTADQSMFLLKSVDIVITREYSADDAGKIKGMIFEEMGKLI